MRKAERQLRGRLVEWLAADDAVRQQKPRVLDMPIEELVARWKPSRSFKAQRRKIEAGSKPRYDDGHYGAVADAYRAAYQAGLPPARAVGRAWNVPAPTARAWIKRCRAKGLLPLTEERKPSA
jgi:hypothetical protein